MKAALFLSIGLMYSVPNMVFADWIQTPLPTKVPAPANDNGQDSEETASSEEPFEGGHSTEGSGKLLRSTEGMVSGSDKGLNTGGLARGTEPLMRVEEGSGKSLRSTEGMVSGSDKGLSTGGLARGTEPLMRVEEGSGKSLRSTEEMVSSSDKGLNTGGLARGTEPLMRVEEALQSGESDGSVVNVRDTRGEVLSSGPRDFADSTLTAGIDDGLLAEIKTKGILIYNENGTLSPISLINSILAIQTLSSVDLNTVVTEEGLAIAAVSTGALVIWKYKKALTPWGAFVMGLGLGPAYAADFCSTYEGEEGFSYFIKANINEQLYAMRDCKELATKVIRLSHSINHSSK